MKQNKRNCSFCIPNENWKTANLLFQASEWQWESALFAKLISNEYSNIMEIYVGVGVCVWINRYLDTFIRMGSDQNESILNPFQTKERFELSIGIVFVKHVEMGILLSSRGFSFQAFVAFALKAICLSQFYSVIFALQPHVTNVVFSAYTYNSSCEIGFHSLQVHFCLVPRECITFFTSGNIGNEWSRIC